jgi:hypothetical protein
VVFYSILVLTINGFDNFAITLYFCKKTIVPKWQYCSTSVIVVFCGLMKNQYNIRRKFLLILNTKRITFLRVIHIYTIFTRNNKKFHISHYFK